MSRNGAGIYSLPPGVEAEPNETIRSAQFNAVANDLEAEANIARPISAGGTGATSKATAQVNLGVVPQSSTTDVTAGRLMINGAFGWGAEAVAVTGDDCDLITASGNYIAAANETLNSPDTTLPWTILHLHRVAGRGTQIAATANDVIYYRTRGADGGWRDWRPIESIVDRQDSGTNGSFIKFADGRINAARTASFTTSISTPHFGAFRCATQTWTFPTPFTLPPKVVPTVTGATAFGAILIGTTTTTQAFFVVTSGSSQTSDLRTVDLIAFGV